MPLSSASKSASLLVETEAEKPFVALSEETGVELPAREATTQSHADPVTFVRCEQGRLIA